MPLAPRRTAARRVACRAAPRRDRVEVAPVRPGSLAIRGGDAEKQPTQWPTPGDGRWPRGSDRGARQRPSEARGAVAIGVELPEDRDDGARRLHRLLWHHTDSGRRAPASKKAMVRWENERGEQSEQSGCGRRGASAEIERVPVSNVRVTCSSRVHQRGNSSTCAAPRRGDCTWAIRTAGVSTGEELREITRPSRSDRPGKAPGRYDFIEVAPGDSNVDTKLTSHVEALEKVTLRARSGALSGRGWRA